MWQAALGALVGYLFAMWWVRRDSRRQLEAEREMLLARLESRQQEIEHLRESFDKSQRAVAAYERRARYLESAITTGAERAAANGNPSTPSTEREGGPPSPASTVAGDVREDL